MTTSSPLPPQNAHHSNGIASARASAAVVGGGSSNLPSGAIPPQSQPQPSSYPHSQQYTPNTTSPTFRAPAHKHAHHLHSIPPREKSTRTLIIDHLLWVHARTRFAQARAELVMTDRTGGPGTPNFAHRERPEQWDEEEEAPSDGEEADVGGLALRARSEGPDHIRDDEEEEEEEEKETRIARQDLPFARRLRQRADSLEKVITSMLGQPPRDIPFPEDEPIAPVPPQQQSPVVTAPPPIGKHVLPNGVRLRLALTTIINALFARQASEQFRHVWLSINDSTNLIVLINTTASTTSVAARVTRPSSLRVRCIRPVTVNVVTVFFQAIKSDLSIYQRQPFAIEPSPRVREMYTAGTSSGTVSTSPFLRCPRHLYQTCEICANPGRGVPARPRGVSRADERPPVAQGGGVSGFTEGAGIGSGLASLGPCGTLLLRGIPPLDETHLAGPRVDITVQNTRLTELIPRFVRLSALVALELGREVGVEEIRPNGSRAALAPTTQWYFLLAGMLTRAVLEGYLNAGWTGLAPVRLLLGVGLGSAPIRNTAALPPSAADDKYEPDGMPELSDAVDVLFPNRSANASAGEGNGYENGEGEGEEGPGGKSGSNAEGGETEYAREMGHRLARFLDVPASTPDLATHLEELTWQYPAEPIERAALRFCEALARWRGKPELETYKKRSPTLGRPPVPTMVLEGGIGSAANAAVRRAIGRYFIIPHTTRTTTTAAATAPADVLVSDEGEGRVVIGRKRAHSIPGTAALDGSGEAGDRWRERRGYL
ncbi:hypothetical protein BC827DRAFT_1157424 [Russula dissimulans]|nr:hypothetical protein BC827DRAFT_1157424 [Russula dissimulans]